MPCKECSYARKMRGEGGGIRRRSSLTRVVCEVSCDDPREPLGKFLIELYFPRLISYPPGAISGANTLTSLFRTCRGGLSPGYEKKDIHSL